MNLNLDQLKRSQNIDFSSCPEGHVNYGGSDRKISIEYNGVKCMLKFANPDSYGFASEFAGCHILECLGFEVQKTYLGFYDGKDCVVCEDMRFKSGERLYELHPMRWFAENLWQGERLRQWPDEQQVKDIAAQSRLSGMNDPLKSYLRVLVADALLGNFDRHWDNIGWLDDGVTLSYAPVYDCGSTLFPKLKESELKSVASSEEALNMRTFKFPNMALLHKGTKDQRWSYQEFLSLDNDAVKGALIDVYPRIDMSEVKAVINNVEAYSVERKDALCALLQNRYDKLLTPAVTKIMDQVYSL